MEKIKELEKFFNNNKEYEDFIFSIELSKLLDNLPIVIEYEMPMNISMNDIKVFIDTFKEKTELDIEAKLYTCDKCNQLHMLFCIDYKDNMNI